MTSIAGQVRLKFMLYSWNAKVIAWDDDDDDGLWLTPRVGSLLCQRLQPHPHPLYPLCSSINLSKDKILKATLVLPVLSHLALSLKRAIYTYKFLYGAFRMGGFFFFFAFAHMWSSLQGRCFEQNGVRFLFFFYRYVVCLLSLHNTSLPVGECVYRTPGFSQLSSSSSNCWIGHLFSLVSFLRFAFSF